MKHNQKIISVAVFVASSFAVNAMAQSVSIGKISRYAEQVPEIALPATRVEIIPRKIKVKPKLTKSQTLPGLGEMPGRKDYFKPVVVRTDSNRTEIIDVAFEFQNRLSTPFADPKVIDQSKADIQKDGQSIYIKPNDMKPFTIFLTGSGANDPVVSLTLVPKSIPSQTILVQTDRTGSQMQMADEEDRPTSGVYTDKVRYVFRQMALGKIPAGYAEAPLPRSIAAIRGLVVKPMTRYSGSTADIYAYRIEGAGNESIELQENSFMQKGVRAVSFFPTSTVRRGVSTMAYIFATKAGN